MKKILLLLGTLFRRSDRFILIGTGTLRRSGIPSIQVMGNIVAVTALGETCQHSGRMWGAMTTLAGRHHFVFVFMAGNTSDAFMLRIGLAVQFKSLLVTGRAHLVGSIGSVGNCSRHMGLMAAFALGSGHIGAVRLVTLRTERDFPMNIMAETAGQISMLALDLL